MLQRNGIEGSSSGSERARAPKYVSGGITPSITPSVRHGHRQARSADPLNALKPIAGVVSVQTPGMRAVRRRVLPRDPAIHVKYQVTQLSPDRCVQVAALTQLIVDGSVSPDA